MKHDTGEEPIFGKFNTERLGQPAFICLWLALVTVLVYEPVFHAQFIGFDDPEYVTANLHVLSGITLANLRWAFVTTHTGNWHPVTWISLMLNSQYFGPSAGAFHAFSCFSGCIMQPGQNGAPHWLQPSSHCILCMWNP